MSKKSQRLNPFQHALKRPDTYIGSAKTISTEVWLYDDETSTSIQKKIRYNPGLFQIVREILSNAIDNVWRSNSSDSKTPVKKIELRVDSESGEIAVWNDGYCIPVHEEDWEYTDHRTGKVHTDVLYPAEVFFGDMFAGTNLNDDEIRKTSGRNGMGAKATNVFSTRFTVECTNPADKAKFTQVYSNNGTEREDPEVEKYTSKTGYTLVSFIPDYKYFQYPDASSPRLDENFIAVLKLYAYEVAMITGVRVDFILDGEVHTIKISSLEKYVRLFYPDTTESKLISLKSPSGDECVLVEGDVPEIDAAEDISQISFVNGIRTEKGGIHVWEWRDSVISTIVRAFNSRKAKKGSEPLKTSAKEIYPYFRLFVRVEVDRPRFASQTKDELTEIFNEKGDSIDYKIFNSRSKKEKDEWMKLLDASVKKILKWNFIFLLEEKLLAKIDRSLLRKDKKVKNRVNNPKADDANKAGTKESEKCTGHITEGASAKAFVVRGIASVQGGQDYNGAIPIKGKFLNVQNASIRAINQNKEVQELKTFFGLRHGVDYSKDENFKTLRYGRVCIVSDADDDGIHIRGLLLNFFYRSYPGLIERGYVTSFSTAVAAVVFKTAKTPREMFFSNPEFREWYEALTPKQKQSLKDVSYYKGLGSIPPRDAPGYFSNPKVVEYFMEGDEDDYMDLGFNEKSSDWRKEWITRDMASDTEVSESEDEIDITEGDSEDDEESDDDDSDESTSDTGTVVAVKQPPFVYEGKLGLSSFVDHQLIIYHKMALRRALPGIWDGLKESQRKVLFGISSRNFKKPKGLEQVSGAIKELTNYHHGAKSLTDTAVKMGQRFVGTNNIPLLVDEGEFGTRLEGGADAAAPRYLATTIESIVKVIFNPLDEPLLERLVEDDETVEFRTYMPIIPMILVNGSKGIASGFATDIPAHNPLDIVAWIEAWLDGDVSEVPDLVPWYRGFTGEIELIKKGSVRSWKSKGILEQGTGKDKGWWHIRELPIGLWTKKFESWLGYLSGDPPAAGSKMKKIDVVCIRAYKAYNGPNSVHFKIQPTKDFIPDMDTVGNLKVMQKTKTPNMVAIDESNYPHKFKSAESILKFFCPTRLEYYQRRKDYILGTLKKDLTKASNRYRYVKAVVDKKLNMYQSDEELDRVMEEEWKFDRLVSGAESNTPSYDYLLSMQMRSMTKKKLEELKKEQEDLEKKIKILKGKSSKDLWREDLEEFKVQYAKFVKTRFP